MDAQLSGTHRPVASALVKSLLRRKLQVGTWFELTWSWQGEHKCWHLVSSVLTPKVTWCFRGWSSVESLEEKKKREKKLM